MNFERAQHQASSPSARHGDRLRGLFLMMLGAAVGVGAFGEGAHAGFGCNKTGAVDVVAISQAEYETLAADAGASACVTPRSSDLTLCQILPLTSDVWTVVAEAPKGGGDAQSAVEIDVYTSQNCLFTASTSYESTDSRWIKATTSDYQVGDTPSQLDFIGVVQIGPASQFTTTVCPYGDGADGHDCSQYHGPYLR